MQGIETKTFDAPPAEFEADLRARLQAHTTPTSAMIEAAWIQSFLQTFESAWCSVDGVLRGGLYYSVSGGVLLIEWVHAFRGFEQDQTFGDWLLATCRRLCAERDCHVVYSATGYAEVLGEEPVADLLDKLGFTTYHSGVFGRDLTAPLPEADLPDGYTFRLVTKADFDAIADLMVRSEELSIVRLHAGHQFCRDQVERIQGPAELRRVILHSGQIVGYQAANDQARICQTYMAKEHRGRRLAIALFSATFGQLRDSGFEWATGTADLDNPAVEKVFKPVGCELVRSYRSHILHVSTPAHAT